MNSSRSRAPAFSSLRHNRNSRAGIYAAGSDPLFGRTVVRNFSSQNRAATNRSISSQAASDIGRFWKSDLLDRLHSPLTRFRD